jgi:hypothetical protein
VILVQSGNRIDGPDRDTPRFPAEQVPAVARRMTDLLELLRPSGVVTAAAAGADLLVAEAAIAGGIPLHIVLMFDRDRFRIESVEDQGDRWPDVYDAVLTHVESTPGCSLREFALAADEAGFRAGNGLILDRALALGGRRVLALAVHPRASTEGSMVDDFVNKAERAGLFVLEVDPLHP